MSTPTSPLASPQTSALASPPPNAPMSVALARALAEAADGFAGRPSPTYLVARYTRGGRPQGRGFDLRGPFSSWEDVPERLQADVIRGERGFFGPYDTSMTPIVHGKAVGEVDLHVRSTPPVVHRIPAGQFDALFFTVQGVEKFAQPYYERIYGPDFAAQVMVEFQQADVQVMAHFPWSEYTDGTKAPVKEANVPMLLRLTDGGHFEMVPLQVAAGTSPIAVMPMDAAAGG